MTMPAAQGYSPGSAEYRRVVVALFIAGLATFALLYSTQPLLPELARRFGLSAGASSLSVSLTTFALGLSLLVVGPLTEALGRTPLIHGSLALSAVVGLATAAAPNWSVLLACRALQGVCLAGLSAVALAFVKEEIHASAHARASGLYIGGTALGGMSGRIVSGWAADLLGWRGAIAVIGAMAVGCAVSVRVMLPASQGFQRRVASPRDVIASSAMALKDPILLGLYLIAFLAMGAFVGTYNALGFRLAAAPYGLSLGAASLIFGCYAFGSIASTVAGALADRFGRGVVVGTSLLLTVVGYLTTMAQPLWLITVAVATATIGFFAAHGVASGWAAGRADAAGAGAGQASSLYLFGYYLGSSVCGTLVTDRWASGGWPAVTTTVVALAAAALLVCVAVTVFARHRTPTARSPRPSRAR